MDYSETNKLGDRKLKTVKDARELFNKMWTKSEGRRKKQALITRQLNGGKPFSDTDLRELGQSWRTNHNFRDATSMLEQVLVAYWRMLHDVTSLIEVTIYNEDDPNNDTWERIFKQNFDRFIRDWGPDYVMNYLLFSFNHVAFGTGVVLWPDAESPKWEAMRLEDVLVKEKAKASMDNLEYVLFRQEVSLDDLWMKIRTKESREAATDAGWNVASIRRCLTRHVKGLRTGDNVSETDDVDVENQLRNTSIGFDADDEPIKVWHVFVKEYDGKINHRVLSSEYETDDYLFDDYTIASRPEKMGESLTAVFFEVGNGYFYGIKGFGHKNYGTSLILNRLKSRAVDATATDGLNFKDMSDGTREVIPITNVGPYNFLPRDVEQIPSYPTGRRTLETIALFDASLSENNARYRDTARSVEQTDTATQANILASLQSQVDVANATLYLTQFGQNIFEQQLKRLRANSDDPDAKLFRKRCLKDGMDPKVFNDAEVEVRTGADPGTASATFRAQILGQLMQMAPGNPKLELNPITEGYVVNTLGASAVRKYTRPDEITDDVSSIQKAQGENADFGAGMPIPVWNKDNHKVHVPVHLQPLNQMAEAYKQSGQPNQDHMAIAMMALPHLEEHMEYMKNNPLDKGPYQQFQGMFASVKAQFEGMFAQVEKLQAEQQASAADQTVTADRGGDPTQALSNL